MGARLSLHRIVRGVWNGFTFAYEIRNRDVFCRGVKGYLSLACLPVKIYLLCNIIPAFPPLLPLRNNALDGID